MRLWDKVYKYPEISLIVPALLIVVGYFLINTPFEIPIKHTEIILVGFSLAAVGSLLLSFFGVIIIYLRLLKKEVGKIRKNHRNQFMISYFAGIYGGLTVLAANLVLSAENLYSKVIAIVGFMLILVAGGIFGLVALTYVLESENENN
jgi:hypothetical protein